MSKKLIITIAAAGLLSFAGSFVLSWLTKAPPPSQSGPLDKPTPPGQQIPTLPPRQADMTGAVSTGDSRLKRAMTEKQLNSLAYEVRESIREYDNKLQDLETREQRLKMAHDILKEDIDKLNNLRAELASMVARLKSERDRLLERRLEIAQAEKDNLMSIAAAYDKMDSGSASKILANMCTSGDPKASKRVFGDKGSNMNDAVKILYYMTERTKAKLLAELVNSEPKLTAVLCEQLKRITEEK